MNLGYREMRRGRPFVLFGKFAQVLQELDKFEYFLHKNCHDNK